MGLQDVQGAVAAEQLVPGQAVRVYTRMGQLVVAGAGAYPSAHGVCVGGRFFEEAIYRFVPGLEEARKPAFRKLDPEALPDDVRLAVTVDHDLSEEQVQRVLAAVGEAALGALRGVGMREDEVYARVAAVLERVREALEANSGESEDAGQAKDRVDRDNKRKRQAMGADGEP